jgi:hypothetical protein
MISSGRTALPLAALIMVKLALDNGVLTLIMKVPS